MRHQSEACTLELAMSIFGASAQSVSYCKRNMTANVLQKCINCHHTFDRNKVVSNVIGLPIGYERVLISILKVGVVPTYIFTSTSAAIFR